MSAAQVDDVEGIGVGGEGAVKVVSAALQAIGAAAGVAALATFVGGALLWIRFDALGLPADQAVARLPKAVLVVVGAHALVAPVIVALLVLLFLYLVTPVKYTGAHRRWYVAGALTMVLLLGAAGFFLLGNDMDLIPKVLVAVGALVLGFGPVVWAAMVDGRPRFIAWVAFAALLAGGAGLAVLRTWSDPRMEPLAVLMKAGERGLSGFYVGETADTLYFAPLPGSGDPGDPFADAQVDRVVSVARASVTRTATRDPVGIDPDEPGRDQAQALLAELQQSTTDQVPKPARPVATINPVVAFAPLVHLHAAETLYPMSAEGFLSRSFVLFSHDGGCDDYSFGLDRTVGSRGGERGRTAAQLGEAKLGRDPGFQRRQTDGRCRSTGRNYRAPEHTRPYDRRDRPKGLALTEGFYLDLEAGARTGHSAVSREGPQSFLRDVPVYFEREPERVGRQPGLRITYWFLYGLSQPPGPHSATERLVHEGDWERISVLLRVPPGDGDRYLPVSARYHFHDGSRDVPWSAVRRIADGGPEEATHPVVYSAKGSHASYPRAGRYENELRPANRRLLTVFDDALACLRCPQWQTWKLVVDARREPWYGFGGAWGRIGGAVGKSGTTGPLGPSRYKLGKSETPAAETTAASPPVPRSDGIEDVPRGNP